MAHFYEKASLSGSVRPSPLRAIIPYFFPHKFNRKITIKLAVSKYFSDFCNCFGGPDGGLRIQL